LIKYLYGKKSILKPLINGDASFRFSDLSHYARLENEKMRDREMSKKFTLDKSDSKLKINGRKIDPNSLTKDIEVNFATRHCFCLCLSNRKNSDELFDKFKADICIEVNTELLLEFLTDFFDQRFKGMKVLGRDITYYGEKYLPNNANALDLVFYKPEGFKHEDEYRIALFYPKDKTCFKANSGASVPFILESESTHISFNYPDKEFLKQFIGKCYEPQA
jgi:hypothetical protein